MNELKDYNFTGTYKLVDLIDNSVKNQTQFWNYNHNYFINSATNFSKHTLLHLYIVTTALNYHNRNFRKNGDIFDDESMQTWYDLFENHNIKIKEFNFDSNDEIEKWFKSNYSKFAALFSRMAEEAFYILFANRNFLLNFNNLVKDNIKEIKVPKKHLTMKGTIKRTTMPKWVKHAVYHRDKGRCVFCNTDLTQVVNILTTSNYDHIVPLDLYGPNDPCNIQLSCEKCNKSKTNKDGSTSNKYIQWWPNK